MMQSYQLKQDTNAWQNQVLVEARSQIDAIANYIDNVLEEMTSFTPVSYTHLTLPTTPYV